MKASIEAAYNRIRALVRETPVEPWRDAGQHVLLKAEHKQHTGSFKFRGASNKIALLTPGQAAAGVIAASNGNHGVAVAAAARARGIAAEVFVGSHVTPAKARQIESHGATLRRACDTSLAAELAARRAAEECGKVFISPYNDSDVIAGQGTIAVELYRQIPRIDAVFAAVGGGGLIGGIGAYLEGVSPATEIVGCWPQNSPVMYECMRAGKVVEVPELPTLSESTAGGLEAGSVTVDICRRVIDRAVFVSETEILEAMHRVEESGHGAIEGAAGVAFASWLRDAKRYEGKTVVVVLCGQAVGQPSSAAAGLPPGATAGHPITPL